MQNILQPLLFVDPFDYLRSHKLNVFLYSRKNNIPVIRKTINNYYDSVDNNKKVYIQKFWDDYTKQNIKAFNGNLVKVNFIDLSSNSIDISFVDYKAFLATSKFEFYKNNINEIANPLTVTPMIITKDRKLIIGYRKNTGNLQFPGGMVDYLKDEDNTFISVKKCAQREIEEELCPIKTYKYKFLGASISLKDIFSTLYVYCHTNITFADIVKKRKEMQENIVDFWEMPEIFSLDLDKNTLEGALNKNCTGTMYAGIMLLGRRLFGFKWYQKNLKANYGGIDIDFTC